MKRSNAARALAAGLSALALVAAGVWGGGRTFTIVALTCVVAVVSVAMRAGSGRAAGPLLSRVTAALDPAAHAMGVRPRVPASSIDEAELRHHSAGADS